MQVLQPTAVATQPLLLQLALAGKAFGSTVRVTPPAPSGEIPWVELQNPAASGVLVTLYGVTTSLQLVDFVALQLSGTALLTAGSAGHNLLAGGPGSKALMNVGASATTPNGQLGGALVDTYSVANLVGAVSYIVVPPGFNFQLALLDPSNLGQVTFWWSET